MQRETMLHLLVQWRKGAGLNQTSLAERLGITQSEVSKFERGERGLDARRLRAWLHVLGRPSAGLVDGLDALDAEPDPDATSAASPSSPRAPGQRIGERRHPPSPGSARPSPFPC